MIENTGRPFQPQRPIKNDLSRPETRQQRTLAIFTVLLALVAATLGCNGMMFTPQMAATPLPTRTLVPTFTPSPESLLGLQIAITPPSHGTPGVIIIPEGVDPQSVLPPLPTDPGIAVGAETSVPGAGENTPDASMPGDLPGGGEGPPTGGTQVEPETPTETVTETPTETPSPTITPSPTNTATPFIVSENAQVALLQGPSVEFPLIAILGANVPVPVTGKNPEGTWLRLCCVNGADVWVAASNVRVLNDTSRVELVTGSTPPPPTPSFTPTETGTETPTPTPTKYPFERALGPQFTTAYDPGVAQLLSLYAKLYVGPIGASFPIGCVEPGEPIPAGKDVPAEGYFLKVTFEGSERPPTNELQPSTGGQYYSCSAARGAGNRYEFNYKYEYRVPDPNSEDFKKQWSAEHPGGTPVPQRCALFGTGTWSVIVVDGTGKQLSDPTTFTTQGCSNPNYDIYIAWIRTR